MGAQDEYLHNFCILQTDKGIVPLTDPLQIAVYNSLQKGMMRPSDLAAELNLSSSSLHFIIDKMTESGIIDRIKPETDKKTVYYACNSILLASSVDVSEAVKAKCERTFEDPLKDYSGLTSLSNMLNCYMEEIGLNVEPLKSRYARDLADSISVEKASMEDAVLNARDVFARLTGYSFSVFSFSPLTLVVTGDEAIRSRADMLMKFVIRLIENSTGRCHRIVSIEGFNGSDKIVKVTMDRCDKTTEPYMNMSIHHRDDNRFFVVDLDGTAGIMTSDVQMEIIDAIYERPLCITDIVNRVNSPRSTITSNLLRMVEEGVISVFYSESGSAYYGLACSILAKKSRGMSVDSEEIRNTLDAVKDKEGAFMEGLLLYTLASLKKYGFESEYLMVVLGAKYMRAMGSMEEQGNFDTYFGQMSDIAKTIGLSLNIVSVYPLTIGITSTDPDSEMSQAMTFIKGMAHQGLEMASSGIFVRSAEEDNISFKEIYPALSMTPVKGVKVENLAAPSAKKRTSSVKTALLNRSRKSDGKPVRTVRYITAAAFMVVLAAVLIFGMSGTGTDLSADTFSLTVSDDLEIVAYDENGDELEELDKLASGATVTLETSRVMDIGYVKDGIAYRLDPNDDGRYSLRITSDLHLEELFDIREISNAYDIGCSLSIYSSDRTIVDDCTDRMIDAETYMENSKGLFVTKNYRAVLKADAGEYISVKNNRDAAGYLPSLTLSSLEPREFAVMPIPDQTITIDCGKDLYYYDGQIVSGVIKLDNNAKYVQMKFYGDRNVIVKADGVPVELDHDNCFTLKVSPADDIRLESENRDLY